MSGTYYSLVDFESFDSKPRRGAENWRFLCPECGQGKTRNDVHRSLSYDKSTGLYHCHRCHLKGKVKEHWDKKGRFQDTTHKALHVKSPCNALVSTKPITHSGQPIIEELSNDALKWRQVLSACHDLVGTLGEAYLQSRGIPPSIAQRAGVLFHPRFYGREAVIFPIKDAHGQPVALQGRFIKSKEGSRMITLGPKKQGVFMTPDSLFAMPIVFTEAPIDALSLALCGCPAIALCGKSGCPQWLLENCAFRTVLTAFDADSAGDEAHHSLSSMLSPLGCPARRLRPIGSKDWNEALQHDGHIALSHWLHENEAFYQ